MTSIGAAGTKRQDSAGGCSVGRLAGKQEPLRNRKSDAGWYEPLGVKGQRHERSFPRKQHVSKLRIGRGSVPGCGGGHQPFEILLFGSGIQRSQVDPGGIIPEPRS